ncbi:SRPBCC family protein [Nocardia sp. NPDC059246]|uniref:SRPBCC family protein n=1 Tax=unclassified Nocardia TaxID=2637762 RepID=UPI0036A0C072
MWKFAHTESTTATPAQLWRHYADPTEWSKWDHEVEWVTVDGPFAEGTTGSLKPAGGPKTRFAMTEVTPNVSFTDVSRLPLATMTFEHRIEAAAEGTRFTHEISIAGPLSPLFARVIGRRAAAELPKAMRKLAELAEAA